MHIVTIVGFLIISMISCYFAGDVFFESSYRAKHVCWLHFYSLNYGFLLPVGALAFANIVLFIVVLLKIFCRKQVRSVHR